jgi:Spy/CpxP family protein refolding chaperone
MRARPNFDLMAKELGLTDEQKPEVKAVLDDEQQKVSDLRQDTSLSLEDRRAKMQAIRRVTTAKMKGILTAEQFEKWQKGPRMGARERRMGPPPGGENAGGTNAPAAGPVNPPQK